MRNYVIINGVNSLTIKGLAINELPPIVKAPMRVLQEEIDGRDGDIITDLGYGAYDKIMTIGLYDGYDINEIIAFFNKEGTIVFSDEADKYYNFKIIEQIDYERLIKFRTASITFHCQPFKYPLTETPVEITNEYVEAEGTDLTLTPTAEAPISIDLKGNTQQDSTTQGKNLLDKSKFTSGKKYDSSGQLVNGGANDYYTTTPIIVKPSTTYRGQGTDYWRVCQFDSNDNLVDYYDYSNTTTTPTITTLANTKYLLISLSGYGGFDSKNLQIEEGSSVTSYEPFVPNSPSPDYPSDIHNVSGDNTIVVEGKQLLDKNAVTTGYLVSRTNGELSRSGGFSASDYIRVKAGTTYTQSNTDRYYSVYYDNNKNYLTYIGTATFTPSQDGYIRTTIANANIDIAQVEVGSSATEYEAYTGQSQLISLGVENIWKDTIGTENAYLGYTGEMVTANDWLCTNYIEIKPNTNYCVSFTNMGTRFIWCEYSAINVCIGQRKENTTGRITTSSTAQFIRFCTNNPNATDIKMTTGDHVQYISENPIELCKIGTYQDYFYKTDKWYLHKEIGKVVLDGSENWSGGSSATTSTNYTYLYTNFLDSSILSNYYDAYCDNFTNLGHDMGAGTSVNTDTISIGYTGAYKIRLMILTSRLGTQSVAGFKTWLGTNKPIIYYVLATPTETEITDSTLINQLEAIKNMTSYDGTTNINQENNDEPFILKAKAVKEGSGQATINNSGNIYSKPTLDIEGTGIVDVYIGANQIFSVNVDEEVIIDSTNLEAYKPDGTLANRNVTGNIANFKLPTGNSLVKVEGDIDKATITNYTRWL